MKQQKHIVLTYHHDKKEQKSASVFQQFDTEMHLKLLIHLNNIWNITTI